MGKQWDLSITCDFARPIAKRYLSASDQLWSFTVCGWSHPGEEIAGELLRRRATTAWSCQQTT